MTLKILCALTPPMCRMAADPNVRKAVASLSGLNKEDYTVQALLPLAHAMLRHPEDAAAALALLGGDDITPVTLSRCFDREALAFFHICGQCGMGEMLWVLTHCSAAPTVEGLALLIREHRRMQAMVRYGLQLLWRMCGDETLPDALALFPEDAPGRNAGDIVEGLLHTLKGGEVNG